MRRKVIKQGHNTLTITLPADWAKKFNLNAGSEVDINEKEKGLFITTQKIHEKKRAEFSIEGLDIPVIWKYFMAVYREGYDEVKVNFDPNSYIESPYKFFSKHSIDQKYKKENQRKPIGEALQGFVNRFIGFEIIEHGKNYIIIKEMGEITDKEFDNSLRRVFLIIQQMAEETLEAIKTNNSSLVAHMHDIDINLDKFQDYCIRVLNKIGHKEQKNVSLLFSTLYLLELIGDEFKNIAIHLIKDFPNGKFGLMEGVASSIKEQIDVFYDLFYKFDVKKIGTISEIDKARYFNVNELYKKAKEEEKEIFHHLRIITRYINALLELRIEMEF